MIKFFSRQRIYIAILENKQQRRRRTVHSVFQLRLPRFRPINITVELKFAALNGILLTSAASCINLSVVSNMALGILFQKDFVCTYVHTHMLRWNLQNICKWIYTSSEKTFAKGRIYFSSCQTRGYFFIKDIYFTIHLIYGHSIAQTKWKFKFECSAIVGHDSRVNHSYYHTEGQGWSPRVTNIQKIKIKNLAAIAPWPRLAGNVKFSGCISDMK